MARMSRTISVRLDDEALQALRLLEASGLSASDAIRGALVESAGGRGRSEILRAEAERLAADPENVREVARVQAEMEDLRGPW